MYIYIYIHIYLFIYIISVRNNFKRLSCEFCVNITAQNMNWAAIFSS